jgi:hypothetical protein
MMLTKVQNRRASIYVMVLGTAAIVSSIALASLVTLQVQSRSKDLTRDRRQAELIARGMVDQARILIESDNNWRSNRSVGVWTTLNSGNSAGQVEVTDPDGNLNDDPMDPIQILGSANTGDSSQKVTVSMYGVAEPIPAITTPIFANLSFSVYAGKRCSVTGGPIFTNGSILNVGTILGDTQSSLYFGPSPSGTRTTGVQLRSLPDASVMSYYVGLAQPVAFTGDWVGRVLTPANNFGGATQVNGVYRIDTGGQDIQISDTRIFGTLIVQCGSSKTVRLNDRVLMQPARPDYPVLITDGNLEINLASGSQNLSESVAAVNFNPPGSPFNSVADSDQTDVYPNEIQGLVHSRASIFLKNESRVIGSLLGEGLITVTDTPNVFYDSNLTTTPPIRYSNIKMKIQSASWSRAVD